MLCPNANASRLENNHKFEKIESNLIAMGNNNAHSCVSSKNTPAPTLSETYPLTLPTSENFPLSSYGLSTHNGHKHVRLGIVAVQIHNPITGQSTNVYAFQDSGLQLTLLRKSVAEEIGLHGMCHIHLYNCVRACMQRQTYLWKARIFKFVEFMKLKHLT